MDAPEEKKKVEKKETAKKPAAEKKRAEQADKTQEGKSGKIESAPNDHKAEEAGTVEYIYPALVPTKDIHLFTCVQGTCQS